jgi:hypothetical protein
MCTRRNTRTYCSGFEVAELSQSAEESEDVQFRVIDPPLLPEDPVAPNRPFLLFGVLLAGLAAGGALGLCAQPGRASFLRSESEVAKPDRSSGTWRPFRDSTFSSGLQPIRASALRVRHVAIALSLRSLRRCGCASATVSADLRSSVAYLMWQARDE